MDSKLEYLLTKTHKPQMIHFIKTHPRYFNELIKLALSDIQNYSWRASWLLWSCMEPNDKRLHKYLHKIVAVLPIVKDSQQRELLIVLQKMKVPASLEAPIIDTCIVTWTDKRKNVSLRYHALKLLVKISKKYPDLWREIKLLAEPQYSDDLSATAKTAVLKLMNELSYEHNDQRNE